MAVCCRDFTEVYHCRYIFQSYVTELAGFSIFRALTDIYHEVNVISIHKCYNCVHMCIQLLLFISQYNWRHTGSGVRKYNNVSRSRRNTRSRCAWLTGPEPRWGYARTSFGVDAAAEVTISKCNLWKSWTLELTSEFSHAHLTIFSTVWDVGWFYQDHASRVNAKLQKIYQYFVG